MIALPLKAIAPNTANIKPGAMDLAATGKSTADGCNLAGLGEFKKFLQTETVEADDALP
jgi:hypothetical protein